VFWTGFQESDDETEIDSAVAKVYEEVHFRLSIVVLNMFQLVEATLAIGLDMLSKMQCTKDVPQPDQTLDSSSGFAQRPLSPRPQSCSFLDTYRHT
jgi:hypothetical protein